MRWAALVVALLMVAGGWWVWVSQSPPAGPPAGPSSGPGAASGSAAGGAGAAAPSGLPAPVLVEPTPGAPRRVAIPSLGVDAPTVGVAAPDRTLRPPVDASTLGWWAGGARPGDRRGSVLIAGHTVRDGPGALNDLERLKVGDRVDVRTDSGVVGYAVVRVQTFAKGVLSERAGRLFSQEVAGRLVLVTCEDWDGARYLSNVVVVAQPLSAAPGAGQGAAG